ncbi:hypothetical protein EYV94_27365 [Puteibacter caeruleilacunae]|nr:hypothetical protein EYV94_27365 [Puteibacter caeruleilacunae]
MSVIISKTDLIPILKKVVEYLEGVNIENFSSNTDFYKLIGTDEWDNFGKDCIDPDIGSLKDDWESLMLLLKDDDRPLTSVDLDRVASILRVVSESISPNREVQ